MNGVVEFDGTKDAGSRSLEYLEHSPNPELYVLSSNLHELVWITGSPDVYFPRHAMQFHDVGDLV